MDGRPDPPARYASTTEPGVQVDSSVTTPLTCAWGGEPQDERHDGTLAVGVGGPEPT